ncbi:MAG: hypothetical protein JO121_09515 [Deltaproteobacteria bacterium]|nr:hypothetical protein [Deltaproteobacteria bacterium]
MRTPLAGPRVHGHVAVRPVVGHYPISRCNRVVIGAIYTAANLPAGALGLARYSAE